jgi:hypothetical protein
MPDQFFLDRATLNGKGSLREPDDHPALVLYFFCPIAVLRMRTDPVSMVAEF